MIRTYGAILFSVLTFPLAAVAQEGTPAGGCQTQGAQRLPCWRSRAPQCCERRSSPVPRGRFRSDRCWRGPLGGRPVAGKKGNATLALGPSCRTTLGASSMVTITQAEGVTCASPVSADPSTAGADLPSRRAPPPPVVPVAPVATVAPFGLAPLAVGAGIVGIGAAAILLSQEDRGRRAFFVPAAAASPPVTPPPFVPVVETPPERAVA